VQLLETTVGKTDNGYLLLVAARLENPNPFDVTLRREWFVLVDEEKNYYQPSTTGTQTALILLPANGVLEKETLSFAVPDSALRGAVGLMVGRNYWVMIKDNRPFDRALQRDEFVSFRRRTW
jgi:hypothetical protein